MLDNLSYNDLKVLPDEEKKEVLKLLKEKFNSYKEMAEKIGGTPLALSNMYLRVVEGRRFGRTKKVKPAEVEESPNAIYEANQSEIKTPGSRKRKSQHTRLQDTESSFLKIQDKEKPNPENRDYGKSEPVKTVSDNVGSDVYENRSNTFIIGLEIETSGEEAGARLQGLAGALLKNCNYRIKLKVEEV